MTRWLQEEIENRLHQPFSDPNIPVISAAFSKTGDVRSFWTEIVESEEDSISLTWYDFHEPFIIRSEAGSNPGRPHGVYSCFIPARRVQITVNGLVAVGKTLPQQRGDRDSSTSCLALSETWLLPR